jgi:paraquat-inducible protein B
MKTKLSPAIVGAFVLGALGIGVIALLALGSLSLFSKPERFMVYFDEAVSGLDEGSPVKLRGVRVGHVVGISIRYDRATGKSVAAVVCELNKGSISDEQGAALDVADRAALQTLVDKGLRAQLEISGLATGLLFVELDFMDPKKYPDSRDVTDLKYVIIPSAPSEISEIRAGIATLMANADVLLVKMEQIDFQGLSTELKGLIAESRKRLEGVDLKGLAEQWRRTGQSVEAVATSPQLRDSIANLNKTLEVLHTSLGHIDAQVGTDGQALRVTLEQAKIALESFNAAAKSARGFIDAQQNFGTEANRALERVAGAAEAVEELADFLERNPNALVSGRKEPK